MAGVVWAAGGDCRIYNETNSAVVLSWPSGSYGSSPVLAIAIGAVDAFLATGPFLTVTAHYSGGTSSVLQDSGVGGGGGFLGGYFTNPFLTNQLDSGGTVTLEAPGLGYSPSIPISGTGTKTAGSRTLVGSGTSFTTAVSVGQRISVSGGPADYKTVTAITDNTHLTVDTAFVTTASIQSISVAFYTVFSVAGCILTYDTPIGTDWGAAFGTGNFGNVGNIFSPSSTSGQFFSGTDSSFPYSTFFGFSSPQAIYAIGMVGLGISTPSTQPSWASAVHWANVVSHEVDDTQGSAVASIGLWSRPDILTVPGDVLFSITNIPAGSGLYGITTPAIAVPTSTTGGTRSFAMVIG